MKVALNGRILIPKDKIWIARLRIDRVAIFRTSASRISNAAVSIVRVEEVLAVIGLGVEDLVVAIGLAVAAAVALAVLVAVADSGEDVENLAWN